MTFVNMFIVLISVFLFNFLIGYNEKTLYKKQSAEYSMITENQRQYFLMLLDKEYETKKFRHDIENYLSGIAYFLKNKDYEKAEKYLADIFDRIPRLKSPFETGNDILNFIVIDLLSRFDSSKFKIQWPGYFPTNTKISDVDLCTIFANLLTNAIEAVEKIETNEVKIIDVSIKTIHDHLYIIIKNPCSKLVKIKNNTIRTDKQNKNLHGFGIINTVECVERYDGEIIFCCSGNEFVVEITFRNIIEIS